MTGAQAEVGVLALLHDLDDLVIDVPLAAGTTPHHTTPHHTTPHHTTPHITPHITYHHK
jgi:hypothetical protein